MIILITAVPGSGKTLFAVELINKYLSEGRSVYANIDGLSINSVAISPDDWRDCQDGSVVVYDECQKIFSPDGAGRSSNKMISDLEEHRHRGLDIVLITQHPKLLHSHVRRLVGRHHHLFRMYGTETAKVFCRDGHIDVDKPSMLHAQDSYLWPYPKALYGLYKSATIHTHKRQLPKWMIRGFVFGGLFVAVASVLFYLSSSFLSGKSYAAEQVEGEYELGNKNVISGIPDTVVLEVADNSSLSASGCVWGDKKCICYDTKGAFLNLSYSQCIAIADSPLKFISLT
jgi:zona occludens toxin (predicted ATPase)